MLSPDYINQLYANALDYKKSKLILKNFNDLSQNDLKNLSVKIMKEKSNIITILLSNNKNGIILMGMVGNEALMISKINMGRIIREIVEKFGGKGGGRADYGQGFIENPDLKEQVVLKEIEDKLSID